MNYAQPLPVDQKGASMQGYPANKPAKQVTAGTPAASSVVSFGSNTTVIEITAGGNPLALKWGAASVIASGVTANFDHLIPAGTVRRFVVPQSVIGATASVVGANTLNGLYNSAALIIASSVISGLTEY